MAASKRRRSASDDSTNHVIYLPNIVVSPRAIVASTSENKDTAAVSRQHYVSGKKTTGSKAPRKKFKGKSATQCASTAEPNTLMKPAAVSGRVTRASSVVVPNPSLRSFTSSQVSARRAKRIHPYIPSRDIYPHLATKDALDPTAPLREEHGSTVNSNPVISTLTKKRGRPSHATDPADEGARAALMEQWADLRMSQGTLLSSITVGRLSETTPHLSSNSGTQEPSPGSSKVEIPSYEVVEPDTPPDFTPASDYMEPTCPGPSLSSLNIVAEPLPEVTITNESISTPTLGFATKNTTSERFPLPEYDLQYSFLSPEISQPAMEDIAPSQHDTVRTIIQASLHSTGKGSPEFANQSLQRLATDGEVMPLRPPITHNILELDTPPESAVLKGPTPLVEPDNYQIGASPSAVDIQLLVSAKEDVDDAILAFHMLDLHEVLSPWVPVSTTSPSVYVPPAVHHLIAGMEHQLEIECQARRRAEELYLEEMRKRIRMEEVVDRLQKEKTREQDESQPPPPPPTTQSVPSVDASVDVARQPDGEARPTSTDITHSKVTTEGFSAS